MAYYGGYQPYYQNPNIYQQPMQSAQASQSGIIWVQGEAGAKSYLVAPNTTVQLWDSEAQVIYLKSADASGMPSIKVLDYTIRSDAPNSPLQASMGNNGSNISRDDLDALQRQIDALRGELDEYRRATANE